MAGFVYFIENRGALSEKDARELGLGYALGGGGIEVLAGGGPPGLSGVSASFPGPSGKPGSVFQASSLDWTPIPGRAGQWIGLDPALPPGPEDLARPEQIDGHLVALADGREWLAPVVRRMAGDTALPRRLSWDGAAWKAGDVLPVYRALWDEAVRLWEGGAAAEGQEVELTTEADFSARVLAVNYRLGPAEISAAGLFTTASELRVAEAALDMPLLKELVKKKRASGPPCSGPGPGA